MSASSRSNIAYSERQPKLIVRLWHVQLTAKVFLSRHGWYPKGFLLSYEHLFVRLRYNIEHGLIVKLLKGS